MKGFVMACAAHLYWDPLATAAATALAQLLLQQSWRLLALRLASHHTHALEE